MVKLDKIYTRGGDAGQTSLGDGVRVSKDSPRIRAYGTVDELNAWIGVARLHAEGEAAAMLERIQHDLFDLGADLCIPAGGRKSEGALRIAEAQVVRLEQEIDSMNAEMQPLSSFILPGGSEASTWLHVARTVCRRAEQEMVHLAGEEEVSPLALSYINRLSDHLFVLGRFLNDKGRADVLWQPGKNR